MYEGVVKHAVRLGCTARKPTSLSIQLQLQGFTGAKQSTALFSARRVQAISGSFRVLMKACKSVLSCSSLCLCCAASLEPTLALAYLADSGTQNHGSRDGDSSDLGTAVRFIDLSLQTPSLSSACLPRHWVPPRLHVSGV